MTQDIEIKLEKMGDSRYLANEIRGILYDGEIVWRTLGHGNLEWEIGKDSALIWFKEIGLPAEGDPDRPWVHVAWDVVGDDMEAVFSYQTSETSRVVLGTILAELARTYREIRPQLKNQIPGM